MNHFYVFEREEESVSLGGTALDKTCGLWHTALWMSPPEPRASWLPSRNLHWVCSGAVRPRGLGRDTCGEGRGWEWVEE